jgi:CxxC motif-containing protein (DUF1111 family)
MADNERRSMVYLSAAIADATGGHVVRQFLIRPNGRMARRRVPDDAVLRRSPSLFGLGDLERVAERVLREYADPNDADGDGVSGRLSRVSGRVGRFGWKARFASVDDAVTAAFVNELGLTTSRYPRDGTDRGPRAPEINDATWRAVSAFVRSLPPLAPARVPADTDHRGTGLFQRIGCTGCHRPTLTVENGADDVVRTIQPYTDLLLHDLGPALADGLTDLDASTQEFRTAPLWGLGQTGPPYLHDGRATTLHDAIVAHAGEAEAAADAYLRLSALERATLLDFVASR